MGEGNSVDCLQGNGPSTIDCLHVVLHDRKWAIALALGVPCVLIVVLTTAQPLVAICLIGLPAAIWLVGQPKVTLVLLVLWVLVQRWLTGELQIIPEQLKFLREVLLCLLVISILLKIVAARQPLQRTPYDLPILAFVSIACLSALVNGSSLFGLVLYLRYFLQYASIFYAVYYLGFNERYLRLVLKIVFAWALLQAPIVIMQVILLFQTRMDQIIQGTFDFNAGTLGPSQGDGLSYLMLGIIMVVLALDAEGIRAPKKLAVLLIIPFVLATSRMMILTSAIFLLWFCRDSLLRLRRQVVLPIILLLFGIVLGFAFYSQGTEADLARIFLPWRILADQSVIEPGHYYGRLGWTRYIIEHLTTRPLGIWLGAGPGMFLSFAAFLQSPLPPLTCRTALEFSVPLETGRGMAGASSDANVLLAEVGILGLIAIGILWLQAFRHVRSIARQAQDRYLRALATGSQYIVIIMGIATMTYNGWEVPYMAALFWLMLGVLTVLSRNDRYAERQG